MDNQKEAIFENNDMMEDYEIKQITKNIPPYESIVGGGSGGGDFGYVFSSDSPLTMDSLSEVADMDKESDDFFLSETLDHDQRYFKYAKGDGKRHCKKTSAEGGEGAETRGGGSSNSGSCGSGKNEIYREGNKGGSSSSGSGGRVHKFKKMTYQEVEKSLDFFEDQETKVMNRINNLITYLKGQAHLYSLSQYVTQNKINILTIPSFLFSIVVTVLAPLTQKYEWSGILISALTATIATCTVCVRFYELDVSCANFLFLANQYNKLQIVLETVSNTGGNSDMKMLSDIIHDVETKINDLTDSNTFLPPKEVKLLIPIISHINIFSVIKNIKITRRAKITKYCEIKNEIRFIYRQWEMYNDSKQNTAATDQNNSADNRTLWISKTQQMTREKKRMLLLLEKKEELRKELGYYRTACSYLDEMFLREINMVDHLSFFSLIYRLLFGVQVVNTPGMNPVVDKYLETIFSNIVFKKRSSSGVLIPHNHSDEFDNIV